MMKKINKKLVLTILVGIVAIAAGVGAYFFYEGSNYYSTDNAKVMADLKTITTSTGGEIIKWDVEPNTPVTENEVIGRMSTGADVKSPITGLVAKSNVVLNQQVAPSAPLAVIADTSDIYILANIEETVASKIALGQSVELKLDAFPGKTFKGHIRTIDPVTVAALSGSATSFNTSGTYTKVTQLIPVKISVDDPVTLDKLIGTNALVKVNFAKVEKDALKKEQEKAAAASKTVETSGIITAKNTRDVALDFSATVADVPVTEGQALKKGDVIITLDLHDILKQISDQEKNIKIENLQLQKLLNSSKNSNLTDQNALQTAQDNYDNAKDNYDKQVALFAAGAATNQTVDDAKRSMDNAKRTLENATLTKAVDNNLSIEIERQKIALMQDQLAQLKNKITKPYIVNNQLICDYDRAVVEGLNLVSGNIFSNNTKLFTLVDLNSLVVNADITENQIKLVKIGSKVDITPVYDTSKHYTGTVTSLSDAGVIKNGETVVTAEIAINAPDEFVKPNFNVEIKISE